MKKTQRYWNTTINPTVEQYLKASPRDLAEANRRYQIIEPYLKGKPVEESMVSERTIRHWKAKFRSAQKKYNWGYIGLIDNHGSKGNRKPKISPQSSEFMDNIIAEHYDTLKQKGKLAVYGVLKHEWEKAGLNHPLPSYVTFCTRIKQHSGYEQTKKRQGHLIQKNKRFGL